MSTDGSVSQWIATLRTGDLAPVQKLWDHYREGLIASARRQLKTIPKLTKDEDDIAQSVLVAIWRGTKAGLFKNVSDRDELWWTLLKITRRKVVTAYRREKTKKRGKWWIQSKERLATDLAKESFRTFEELCDEAPTPEMACALEEQANRLIGILDRDDLKQIALWRIEGLTVDDIAGRLSLTTRSIERKLKLIRKSWSRELSRA
jgi:DNA-directed RNA polymerase specialized sigma24 family protein